MSTRPGVNVSVAHGRVQDVKIMERARAREQKLKRVRGGVVSVAPGMWDRARAGESGGGCAGSGRAGCEWRRGGTGEPTMYARMFDCAPHLLCVGVDAPGVGTLTHAPRRGSMDAPTTPARGERGIQQLYFYRYYSINNIIK